MSGSQTRHSSSGDDDRPECNLDRPPSSHGTFDLTHTSPSIQLPILSSVSPHTPQNLEQATTATASTTPATANAVVTVPMDNQFTVSDEHTATPPPSSFTQPIRFFSLAPSTSTPAGQPQARAKRRQVKNACSACQKACKKCDDGRPCNRCVLYNIGEDCVDSQRKERLKGHRRGPYKKRDGKGKIYCRFANVAC